MTSGTRMLIFTQDIVGCSVRVYWFVGSMDLVIYSKANERGVSQLRTAVEFGVIGGLEPIQKSNLQAALHTKAKLRRQRERTEDNSSSALLLYEAKTTCGRHANIFPALEHGKDERYVYQTKRQGSHFDRHHTYDRYYRQQVRS